jgi:hypothetical protein
MKSWSMGSDGWRRPRSGLREPRLTEVAGRRTHGEAVDADSADLELGDLGHRCLPLRRIDRDHPELVLSSAAGDDAARECRGEEGGGACGHSRHARGPEDTRDLC